MKPQAPAPHRPRHRLVALLLLPLLAACDGDGGSHSRPAGQVSPDAQTPLRLPPADFCGASRYQALVGQPETALNGLSLPSGSRVIRPGQMVTMDFRAERLSISVDRAGRISRADCG